MCAAEQSALEQTAAEQHIRSLLSRNGSLSFSTFMHAALYEPEIGFYQTVGVAGRRNGDFITSPEVGPLFGTVLARVIDTEWRRLGQPDPFFVFDVGAGPGTLAKSILRANPECTASLRYVLVETSSSQRALHNEHLELEDANEIFGVAIHDDDLSELVASQGPLVTSIAELPSVRVDGVVIANELFDNIPFDIAEYNEDKWNEVLVTEPDNSWQYSLAPLSDHDEQWLLDAMPNPTKSLRVPLFREAESFLQKCFDLLESGTVLVIDYGSETTAELAERSPSWLRTYRNHERGDNPFTDIGRSDITADVAFDQLARIKKPTQLTTQTEFLHAHGINELVEQGKQIWNERASIGDLEAMKARSRVNEAEALCDPKSLGSFLVAEWQLS